MSSASWRGIKLAIALFIAAVLQSVAADACRIAGARPDLLLTCALIGAALLHRYWRHGRGSGPVVCCIACLASEGRFWKSGCQPNPGLRGDRLAGRKDVPGQRPHCRNRRFRRNAARPNAFFLFAPQRDILHWLGGMLGTCLYNTLLAAPVYLIIRRILGRDGSKEPVT